MNKEFFDKVKSTMNTAADSLSTVAQNFVEKNRTKAKLNRLRMVMKSESELMNRAYIELGKEFYEALKKDGAVAGEKQKNLVEVVDKSKAKIARARECYRSVLEQQNEFIYASPSTVEKHEVKQEEVVDITVACSNEDDYSSSPFENCEPSVRENVIANPLRRQPSRTRSWRASANRRSTSTRRSRRLSTRNIPIRSCSD